MPDRSDISTPSPRPDAPEPPSTSDSDAQPPGPTDRTAHSGLPATSAVSTAQRVAATAVQTTLGVAEFTIGSVATRELSPRRAARQVRTVFERLGPTYVKLGQLIASSPGVFTPTLSGEFESLLDRVAPASPDTVAAIIAEELGQPVSAAFAGFDETPIASASIAQVHTARLHSSESMAGESMAGESVVVKVQRPDIAGRLAADVEILSATARVAELSRYGRMAGARGIIADFAESLDAELDFRTEAAAMEEFSAQLATTPYADLVRTARVDHAHTTRRVLTMERITDAVRIDDVAAIRRAGHDGTALVRTLLLTFLESALHGGLFHGDLHAGNVLVDSSGRIVLLDFGIVGRFDERTRRLVRGLFGDLLVRNDYESAGRALVELGAVRRPGSSTREGAKDLRRFAAPLAGKNLSDVSYGDLGRRLTELAAVYDVRLPRELVLIGKQLLYVEKYMKLLAPRWRAFADRAVLELMARIINEDTHADEQDAGNSGDGNSSGGGASSGSRSDHRDIRTR